MSKSLRPAREAGREQDTYKIVCKVNCKI